MDIVTAVQDTASVLTLIALIVAPHAMVVYFALFATDPVARTKSAQRVVPEPEFMPLKIACLR